MAFKTIDKRGIHRFLVDESLPDGKLSVHRSVLEAGRSSHSPHTHDGVEAFVVLRGTATIQTAGQDIVLGQFESLALDSSTPHAIRNDSDDSVEYLVINSK